MALSSMLRRGSPSVVPLALRAIVSPGTLHGALSTVVSNVDERGLFSGRSSLQSYQFSSVAVAKRLLDESLVKVLKYEIKSAKESVAPVAETPEAFPFKIQDKPGERSITLTREFPDETIEIKVDMPPPPNTQDNGSESDSDNDHCSDDSDDSSDDNSDSDGDSDSTDDDNSDSKISTKDGSNDSVSTKYQHKEESAPPSIPMTLTVLKKKGQCLEFNITASTEEIFVNSMSIKESYDSKPQIEYKGPNFGDLDSGLQHSLQKYLEIRGIKLNTASFLHEYMVKKNQRDDLLWLKKLKKFIKN